LAASPDSNALSAQLRAAQALLHAESPAEVRAIVLDLVHDLGGNVAPAGDAHHGCTVPVDVSLGLSEPLLPLAEPSSQVALRLNDILPSFLDSARIVLARLHSAMRRDEEASRDQLTRLLSRGAWMRRLAGAAPGDSVCFIDLDHFKTVNDSGGHASGDAVLRAIGELMLRTFRKDDSCGRYGGDELVCLTEGLSGQSLVERCEQLRRTWEQERPAAGAHVGLSIGVAEVRDGGGLRALQAADLAMYRGKNAGRNQTLLARPDDYGDRDES
jgi:diguanylate cyclase (GGDEF)-like protein